MEKPLITFRVYPESRRSFYFTVRVFKTLRGQREHCKKVNGAKYSTRRQLAVVQSWTAYNVKNKRRSVRKEVGEILFSQKHVGVKIVSHECTHAALRWSQRANFAIKGKSNSCGLCSDNEERFCHGLSNMVGQIYTVLYDKKVIK